MQVFSLFIFSCPLKRGDISRVDAILKAKRCYEEVFLLLKSTVLPKEMQLKVSEGEISNELAAIIFRHYSKCSRLVDDWRHREHEASIFGELSEKDRLYFKNVEVFGSTTSERIKKHMLIYQQLIDLPTFTDNLLERVKGEVREELAKAFSQNLLFMYSNLFEFNKYRSIDDKIVDFILGSDSFSQFSAFLDSLVERTLSIPKKRVYAQLNSEYEYFKNRFEHLSGSIFDSSFYIQKLISKINGKCIESVERDRMKIFVRANEVFYEREISWIMFYFAQMSKILKCIRQC